MRLSTRGYCRLTRLTSAREILTACGRTKTKQLLTLLMQTLPFQAHASNCGEVSVEATPEPAESNARGSRKQGNPRGNSGPGMKKNLIQITDSDDEVRVTDVRRKRRER